MPLILQRLCLVTALAALPAAARAADPQSAPAQGLAADDAAAGLLSPTAALLDACLDDYNSLRFDRAEAEARDAMALQPEHPLPCVYLQATLCSEIQEQGLDQKEDPALLERFDQATVQAQDLESAWEHRRQDAWGAVYLGNSLGARALVAMYRHRLLRSYTDGRESASALRLAQKRVADQPDADLGLGQYLYFCGRLSGVMRFFLVLHGDIPGGIARLKHCADSDCRSAILAKIVLSRILVEEVPDYEAALPYVQVAYQRYPLNWAYAKQAQEEALALGMGRPEARALAEALRVQWRSGWRPPAYAKMDPSGLFLALDVAEK
ncbi:MAG TPA: hypothetical protein VNZ67_06795 [bacterium]|jgi:hypothetical protein|nr:hypothetical protein [bacterium]